MSVRIQFDKPNACQTNLDFVTGRVILILQSDTTVQAITVKLEGESKTRLAGPRSANTERNDKQKIEIEIHKLLYKVLTIFPDPEIQQSASSSSSYTLLAGHYEYPFRFKLPFNNSCGENKPKDLKLGSVALAYVGDTNQHVKRALPPTLAGFPGQAEIRYYVKATVRRPQVWRADLRTETNFKFLPLEPPRPPDNAQEVFARRKQQFSQTTPAPAKTGLFRRATVPDPSTTDPPLLQVEARLPVNTIITCNEPLPLRVLVQKLNPTPALVYLSTLQIELIARTHVRAHGLKRVETSSLILTSKSNMTVRIGSSNDEAHVMWVVPSWLWDNIPLPDSVPPSFDTCNISRTYELDLTIGLTHGGESGPPRPQLMTLPLRMPVKVYSGIKPPPALLRAIATSHPRPPVPLDASPRPPPMGSHPSFAHTPSSPSTPSYEQHSPQTGTLASPQQTMSGDDAPPSYEDAMADEIAPVDGPRRDYNIPSQPEQRQNSLNDESKGSGLSRRPSERLFAQNNVQSPNRSLSADQTSFDGSGQVPTSPVLPAVDESPPLSSTTRERNAGEVVGKTTHRAYGHNPV